jgi:hypothetical protein
MALMFAGALVAGLAEAGASINAIPLSQFGMIMTHDAATGYLSGGWDHAVHNWAKTQGGKPPDQDDKTGFAAQLDCGARAFDVRPKLDGSKLVMHHGGITVDTPVTDAVREVINWASIHPTELVILYVSHYDGDGCEAAALKALADIGITVLTNGTGCTAVAQMTVGQAITAGKLANGGSVLAVNGCVAENYDPSIECYGTIPAEDEAAPAPSTTNNLYTCYASDADAHYPMDQLFSYMNTTTSTRNPFSLWMAQGHWQQSAQSIADGQSHFSTLLDDEHKAGVNARVAASISGGDFKTLNFVELDAVCDAGPAVYSAITAFNDRTAEALKGGAGDVPSTK